jgi:hypothetical protein
VKDDQAEFMGKLWDSMTTGERIRIGVLAVTAIAASFTCGSWVTKTCYENQIVSINAKHDAAILDLKRESSQPPPIHIGLSDLKVY